MNFNIRKTNDNEYKILDDFLYEAIYIPEGVQQPPKTIINNPEVRYIFPILEKRKMIFVSLQR